MVETIAPVVHGGRRNQYWFTVALHALGATTSAAAMGAALGGLGSLADTSWGGAGVVAVGTLSAAYLLRELVGVPVPIPHLRRQVPEWWRTFFSAPAAAFLYGLGLGIGFLTFLSGGTLVVAAVAAFVSDSALAGAVLCAPFGLARGLAVGIGWRASGEEGASELIARLEATARTFVPRAVNAMALFLVVLAALAVAL
jgi:hypothetical protein